MRKSKFTEDQITHVFRQVGAGKEVCHRLGVIEITSDRWRRVYEDVAGLRHIVSTKTKRAKCLGERLQQPNDARLMLTAAQWA